MIQPSRPARPPINSPKPDPLMQALTQKSKVEGVLKKYGKEPVRVKPIPKMQWEGDPNG